MQQLVNCARSLLCSHSRRGPRATDFDLRQISPNEWTADLSLSLSLYAVALAASSIGRIYLVQQDLFASYFFSSTLYWKHTNTIHSNLKKKKKKATTATKQQ